MGSDFYLNMAMVGALIMELIRTGLQKIRGQRVTSSSLLFSLLGIAPPIWGAIAIYYPAKEENMIGFIVILLLAIAFTIGFLNWNLRKKQYSVAQVEKERLHKYLLDILNRYRLYHTIEKEYSKYKIQFKDPYIRSVISLSHGDFFKKNHTISVTRPNDIPELKDILTDLDEQLTAEPLKWAYVKGIGYLLVGCIISAAAIGFLLNPDKILQYLFGIN